MGENLVEFGSPLPRGEERRRALGRGRRRLAREGSEGLVVGDGSTTAAKWNERLWVYIVDRHAQRNMRGPSFCVRKKITCKATSKSCPKKACNTTSKILPVFNLILVGWRRGQKSLRIAPSPQENEPWNGCVCILWMKQSISATMSTFFPALQNTCAHICAGVSF